MRVIRFGFVLLLCVMVALYAAQYWSGWVFIPGFEPLGNALGVLPLALHAGFGSLALIIGPFQFISRLRASWPRLHRMIGKIYVSACLASGAAGLTLAFGSEAGPVTQAGFAALAVIWLVANVFGWRAAMNRQFVAHRRWMWRSMALTFAAVTLRFLLPGFMIAGVEFATAYAIIAWACWLPNLLVIELWLRVQPAPGRHLAAS